WLNRAVLEVSVLQDRNPIFVQLSDGGLRNGFTVKILNKQHHERSFHLGISGIEGSKMSIVGYGEPTAKIDVAPDDLRALKVHVTVPSAQRHLLDGSSTPFQLEVIDAVDGSITHH